MLWNQNLSVHPTSELSIQSVTTSTVGTNSQGATCGKHSFESTHEGVEGLGGIWLLRPECFGNSQMRQLMGGRREKHGKQLMLHGREMDNLTRAIVEMIID